MRGIAYTADFYRAEVERLTLALTQSYLCLSVGILPPSQFKNLPVTMRRAAQFIHDRDPDHDPDPDPDHDHDRDRDHDRDPDPDHDRDRNHFCLKDRFILIYQTTHSPRWKCSRCRSVAAARLCTLFPKTPRFRKRCADF